MASQKRIIQKSQANTGRVRPGSEKGKRSAKQRPNRAMAHGGDSALVIDGQFSASEKKEIFAIIESHGLKAARRNPDSHIDRIDEKAGRISVFVTDNHLALELGKAVHAARKGGHLTITWSHDDKPVFVHWQK